MTQPTVWLVIPTAQEAALRAHYAGEKVRDPRRPAELEDEAIGRMVPNAAGTKLMTGTTRMSPQKRTAFAGRKPAWLAIHTTWPPADWEDPPR